MRNRECETWRFKGPLCKNKDLKEWRNLTGSVVYATFCKIHWDRGIWVLKPFHTKYAK